MLLTRVLTALLLGSLLAATAFAGDSSKWHSNSLTKDQITAIHQECAKANNGSMKGSAYHKCVKEKEQAARDQGKQGG